MTDPRIAVVGAGHLSTRRIYPYIGAAGGELVGVCDLQRDKAETNARRFGGRAYGDLDAMLDAESPDGVIVCVGPGAHADLAIHVLRRGLPVYTEKPPALSAADARAVARVAYDAGLLCMTGFKKRYAAAYRRARQWVDGFPAEDRLALGVTYASAHYANDAPSSTFLLDFCIHAIDLVGYLFGDVAEVCAMTLGGHAYAVCLRFVCGAVGTMHLTDGRSFQVPTEEVELTVRGGNWMTVHNSSVWRIAAAGEAVEWREPPTFTSAGDSGHDTGHLAEIEAFVAALRGDDAQLPSTIDQSARSMALYEAIAASAQRGSAVPVDYGTGP